MLLAISVMLASLQLLAQVQEPQVQIRREEQIMKNLIFYRTAHIDGSGAHCFVVARKRGNSRGARGQATHVGMESTGNRRNCLS